MPISLIWSDFYSRTFLGSYMTHRLEGLTAYLLKPARIIQTLEEGIIILLIREI